MLNSKKLIIASMATLVSVAVFAKDGDRLSFADLDADGNGEITAAEFQAQKDAKFAEADTDGNGELSQDELAAMKAEHKDDDDADDMERKTRIFNAMDKDGSGGLSQDELSHDRQDVMIAAMDADSNGTISEEEFDAQKGKRGHGDGGRGHDKDDK